MSVGGLLECRLDGLLFIGAGRLTTVCSYSPAAAVVANHRVRYMVCNALASATQNAQARGCCEGAACHDTKAAASRARHDVQHGDFNSETYFYLFAVAYAGCAVIASATDRRNVRGRECSCFAHGQRIAVRQTCRE